MKAVTIAKIARLIVIIAVAVVIAIPTFAGIESFRINSGEFVMTDSIYEVNCMTVDDLVDNIKEVTDEKSGYKITYGNQLPAVDVPADLAGIEALATTIKSSATPDDPEHGVYYTATLMKEDGSITKQKLIKGTENLTMHIFTGIKMTESMVNMVKMSVSMDSVINGKKVVISEPKIEPMGDSYRVKIKIPYLTFASAIAVGLANDLPEDKKAKIGLTIGVDYNAFFDAKFRLELPFDTFFKSDEGGGGMPDVGLEVQKDPHAYSGSDPTYNDVIVNEEIKITAPAMDGLESISGSIGTFGNGTAGVRLEVDKDTGQILIMSTGDGEDGKKLDLVEAFEKSRDPVDKSLTINPDPGSGMDPIRIEADQVDSLKEMAAELIEFYRSM